MKIAFLMGGLDSNGGIGRVVSIISDRLSKYHEIFLISYFPYHSDTSLYKFGKEIKILSLNARSSMKKYLLRGGVKKIKKLVQEEDFDYLIACGALFYPISVLACIGTKTKCVCWEHSNADNSADHGFQMACRWVGAKFADAVVVLTKHDYRLYTEKYHTKTLYQIYNPSDDKLTYRYNLEINSKKIISVGRLAYQKNYPLLINVAKRILTEFPDWSWDIYGEGPDREDIETRIQEAGISARLILKGQVDNLYDLYDHYCFLVSTSRYEGFSMAIIEALSTGLPVISFDVECGPKELIEDGVNGYLVEELNEDRMYEKVKELCENRQKCLEMSMHTKNIKNIFDLNKITDQWNQLFQEIQVIGG